MHQLNIFHEHVMEACAQRGLTEESVLLHAKKAGIDGLECDWVRLKNAKEKAALFDGCGIKADSIYRSFDMGRKDIRETEKEYRELFDIAAVLGTKKVLCIPGFIYPQDDAGEMRRRMNDQLAKMCEAGREYGIAVTLEDYDNVISPCSTMGGLREFFDAVPALGFSFDTGNFAYSDESALEAFHLLKDRIIHVHLKDRTRDKAYANAADDNWISDVTGKRLYPVPVGDGFIGIAGLLKELHAIGYKGAFSLEHFGAADQLDFMVRSAENVRAALAAL